ncbi:MAG: multiheme c-type cytochrome [Planctomycetota bacterium]
MSVPRLAAGLAVAGVGLWYLAAVFVPGEGAAAPPAAFTSSAQCRECHATVYAEWERSQHAYSWNNPATRFLSNDFANHDCIDCHASRPVFVTGIGERVLPREERRVEGVDCISCHELPDGGMAGTIADPRAACRPVERIELVRPEFCAGCHNQHKTVDQWRESAWPARGMDCLACHMPFRGGDPNAGRDHTFLGGNDLAMLRRAVTLAGRREGETWVAEIENVGAGHAFPTDERSRTADLFWRPLPAAGAEPGPWRFLHRIRDPYRTETDLPITLLYSGERRPLPIADPEARGAIEVALFYKRSPYWEDPSAPDPEREAILVHRIRLEP